MTNAPKAEVVAVSLNESWDDKCDYCVDDDLGWAAFNIVHGSEVVRVCALRHLQQGLLDFLYPPFPLEVAFKAAPPPPPNPEDEQ